MLFLKENAYDSCVIRVDGPRAFWYSGGKLQSAMLNDLSLHERAPDTVSIMHIGKEGAERLFERNKYLANFAVWPSPMFSYVPLKIEKALLEIPERILNDFEDFSEWVSIAVGRYEEVVESCVANLSTEVASRILRDTLVAVKEDMLANRVFDTPMCKSYTRKLESRRSEHVCGGTLLYGSFLDYVGGIVGYDDTTGEYKYVGEDGNVHSRSAALPLEACLETILTAYLTEGQMKFFTDTCPVLAVVYPNLDLKSSFVAEEIEIVAEVAFDNGNNLFETFMEMLDNRLYREIDVAKNIGGCPTRN